MKIVYVAGKYRGETVWDIAENVRTAERVGLEVARCGAMPLIPHANTAHFHGIGPDEFWIEGTLELLRRCDAVMVCHNWKDSAGARAEVTEAERLRLPVFHLPAQLRAWIVEVSK